MTEKKIAEIDKKIEELPQKKEELIKQFQIEKEQKSKEALKLDIVAERKIENNSLFVSVSGANEKKILVEENSKRFRR